MNKIEKYDMIVKNSTIGYVGFIDLLRTDTPTVDKLYYRIHFLNEPSIHTTLIEVFIEKYKWKIVNLTPKEQTNALYPNALIKNTLNNKVSLIIKTIDLSFDKNNDPVMLSHSRFWYKIQTPGQKQELLSQTFIERAEKEKYFEIFKRK